MRGLLGVVVVAMAATGCEGQVIFHGEIRVAEEVAPDESARVLLLINDDYRYPAETIDGMWGTRQGGLYVIEPYAELETENTGLEGGFHGEVTFEPGVPEVSYWRGEFAYYPDEVWLGAFLDENDNGVPDAGEPWGPYRDNPITDLPFNAPPEDPLIVDIDIELAWDAT
jgi:hypothetical protein